MGDLSLNWGVSGDVDFDIETEETQEEKSEEDVAKEQEEQAKQKELLENANIGKQVAEGLSQLGLQLSETQKQTIEAVKSVRTNTQTPQPTEKQKSMLEKAKTEIGDNYYDNPISSTEKIVDAMVQDKLGPILQQIIGIVKETATETGKTTSSQDATLKFVIDSYPDEIQEELNKLPPGPRSYRQACQLVGANHLTELVKVQVEAALEEKNKHGNDQESAGNTPSKPRSFSEAGIGTGARVASSPKPKIKISAEQLKKDKEWAISKGLDWKYAAKNLYGEKIAAQLAKQKGE